MALRAAAAAPGGHVAELDGARALATLSVFFFHALWRTPALDPLRPVLGHADMGVEVFFILSGFLVTRPLVAHAMLGARPVRFTDFWRRRIARIWPAYIAALVGLRGPRCRHHRRRLGLDQARAVDRQLVRRRRRDRPPRVVDPRRGGRLLRADPAPGCRPPHRRPPAAGRVDPRVRRPARLRVLGPRARRPSSTRTPGCACSLPICRPSGPGCCSRSRSSVMPGAPGSAGSCAGSAGWPLVPASAGGSQPSRSWRWWWSSSRASRRPPSSSAATAWLQSFLQVAIGVLALAPLALRTITVPFLSCRVLTTLAAASLGFFLWHIQVLRGVRPLLDGSAPMAALGLAIARGRVVPGRRGQPPLDRSARSPLHRGLTRRRRPLVVGTGVDPVTSRFSDVHSRDDRWGPVSFHPRKPWSDAQGSRRRHSATGPARGTLAGSSRDRSDPSPRQPLHCRGCTAQRRRQTKDPHRVLGPLAARPVVVAQGAQAGSVLQLVRFKPGPVRREGTGDRQRNRWVQPLRCLAELVAWMPSNRRGPETCLCRPSRCAMSRASNGIGA